MRAIKNKILEQVVEMLIDFDKRCNSYQTDVYLYYDEENQSAKLVKFANVGGRSYLDDDHYTLFTDKEHHEDKWDWYQEISEIADALNKTEKDLLMEILSTDSYYDSIGEIDYHAVKEYVQQNKQYEDILQTQYEEHINELVPDYISRAKEILLEFEEEYDFEFEEEHD